MALEEVCPRLLWRIDTFSTVTRRKSCSFRFLNADWQWEYVTHTDDSNDGLDDKSVVYLTRLSSVGKEMQVRRFLSFVYVKTPEGRKTLEQMYTYDMEPRSRWIVFEVEKNTIVKRGLTWKDGCIFSCSFEPLGTYEQLASLEKESQRFTSPCSQCLCTDIGKLLTNSTFTDITLECRGSLIPAHRSILAFRSEKFASLLESTKYNASQSLTVEDIEPEVLKALIGYIYTSSIELSTDIAMKMYKASIEYGIHSLMKRSALFIMENLNNFDACDILLLAEEYKDSYLKGGVSSYIANDLTTLTSENWKNFSERHKTLAIEVFQTFVERSYVRL